VGKALTLISEMFFTKVPPNSVTAGAFPSNIKGISASISFDKSG